MQTVSNLVFYAQSTIAVISGRKIQIQGGHIQTDTWRTDSDGYRDGRYRRIHGEQIQTDTGMADTGRTDTDGYWNGRYNQIQGGQIQMDTRFRNKDVTGV